jgi:hypothetical protein
MQEMNCRLENLHLDDEGKVDWTTFNQGVGVWALKDRATLVSRFADGSVQLPDKDFSKDWKIINNHTVEEAQITNGVESLSLWAIFKSSLPSIRKINITALGDMGGACSMPAITDTTHCSDTLKNRRRLLKRLSSNAASEREGDDPAPSGSSQTIRFQRRVKRCHPDQTHTTAEPIKVLATDPDAKEQNIQVTEEEKEKDIPVTEEEDEPNDDPEADPTADATAEADQGTEADANEEME